jgi:hypothetical protein
MDYGKMTPAAAPAAPPLSQARFTQGALSRLEGPYYDSSLTPGASVQAYPLMEIPTGGWERNIFLQVSCTTAANAAAVAFAADAPWNAISELTFRDARGNTIIGPLSGFDLFLANKWLGYQWNTDLAAAPGYAATAGAVATGGSFSFIVPVPVELIGRDAIASLANGASNTALRIQLSLNTSAAIYTTAPTTLAAVRVRAFHTAWQQPPAATAAGQPYAQAPVGAGTFHQVTKSNYPYAIGENRILLARKGNPIRGLVSVFRNASAVRVASSTILGTNPFQLFYEGSDLISGSDELHRFLMWSSNNIAAANLDTGVIAMDWANDLDGKTGAELREQWLPTQPGSRIELRFTATAAGTLDVITDEVIPQGDLAYVV